jgi:hypothetical protein
VAEDGGRGSSKRKSLRVAVSDTPRNIGKFLRVAVGDTPRSIGKF